MRKINKITLKYLIETFYNYKIINKSIYNIDSFINLEIDLKESSISIVKYEYRNCLIEIDHNNSKIILSRKE